MRWFRYPACDLWQSAPGVYVFDFCQNMAGFSSLHVPEGVVVVANASIEMLHAEAIHGPLCRCVIVVAIVTIYMFVSYMALYLPVQMDHADATHGGPVCGSGDSAICRLTMPRFLPRGAASRSR